MEFTTHNVTPDADEVRTDEVYGRTHVVAPVVMVVEGVLKDGYLPGEELSYAAHGWNGRPITAPPDSDTEAYSLLPDDLPDGMSGHPLNDSGEFVSANQDPYASDMRIGEVRNAEYDADNATLTGEAWLDIERVKTVGTYAEQVVKALVDGDPLDVSIGFWHDIEKTPGAFNDTEYEYVVRNIMPDHLAMLPNETGECSWEDGCGVPRAASATTVAELESVTGVEPRLASASNQNHDQDTTTDAATLRRRFASLLGIDASEPPTEQPMTDEDIDIDIDALSDATGVATETLDGMDEDDLVSLAENVPCADGASADGDGEGASVSDGDEDGIDTDAVESLTERINDLEESLERTQATDLSDEVDAITAHTDYEREAVESWPEDAITAMAETVQDDGALYSGSGPGVNRLGQVGAASEESDDPADELGAVGALQGMNAADEGGD